MSKASSTSKNPIKITSQNIFNHDDPRITEARRAKLALKSEYYEIRAFSELIQIKKYQANQITPRTWIRKGYAIGVIGDYVTETLEPLSNVTSSTEAVANFVNDKKPIERVKNIFESGSEIGSFADEVVGGCFIPDTKGVKIESGEWYELKWASLYVEVKNFKNIPDAAIRRQFNNYFQQKHPRIYQKLIESNEPTDSELNISDRQSTSKGSPFSVKASKSSGKSSESIERGSSSKVKVSNLKEKASSFKDKAVKPKVKDSKSSGKSSESIEKASSSKTKVSNLKEKASSFKDKALKPKDKDSKSSGKSSESIEKSSSSKVKVSNLKEKVSSFKDKALKPKVKDSKSSGKSSESIEKAASSKVKVSNLKEKASSFKDKALKPKGKDSKSRKDLKSVDKIAKPKHVQLKSKKEKSTKFIENDSKTKHRTTESAVQSTTKSSESLVPSTETQQSSSANQLPIEPPQMDSGKSQKSLMTGELVASISNEPNQNNPKGDSTVKPSIFDTFLLKMGVNKDIEALKQELSKYSALAITAFKYEDTTMKKRMHFNVVFVHFVDKHASNDHQLQTRLISFEPTGESDVTDAVKRVGLDNIYVAAVAESDFKLYIEAVGSKITWIQCSWEFLQNHIYKKDIFPSTTQFIHNLYSNEMIPVNLPENDEIPLDEQFGGERKPELRNFGNLLNKIDDFSVKVNEYLQFLREDFSGSNLLTILFNLRNSLQKDLTSDRWAKKTLDLITEKMLTFKPIQLVAFFLSPFDLQNWMNPDYCGDFEFTEARKQIIIKELENFEEHIPENERNILKEVDESLEPARKRQKFLRDEVNRNRGIIENEQASTISHEVDQYIALVKSNPDWSKHYEFELLDNKVFPRLKRAALFYLSVPTTIRPCVSLIRESLVKARAQNGELSIEEKLFKIINKPNLIADENENETDNPIVVVDDPKNSNDPEGSGSGSDKVKDSA